MRGLVSGPRRVLVWPRPRVLRPPDREPRPDPLAALVPGDDAAVRAMTTTTRTGTRPGARRSIVIGSRRDACDVWTSDPFATLRVSGMHARITQLDDGRFMIEDLGSIGGTFITNPLLPGEVRVTFPMIAAPGSRIRLGTIELPWSVDR